MGERLNIKNMMIESEKPPAGPFDPEGKLNDHDWRGIFDYLEQKYAIDAGHIDETYRLQLATPHIRMPPQFYGPWAADRLWENIRASIQSASWLDAGGDLARAKILFPQSFDKMARRAIVDDSAWQKIIASDENLCKEKFWAPYLSVVIDTRLAFPEQAQKLGLDDKVWQGGKEILAKHRSEQNWGYFMFMAARLKLLFPEHVSELNLDEEAWRGMQVRFEEYRDKPNYEQLIGHIFDLKILFAERAAIGDGKLELTVPKRKSLSGPGVMPENRKF